jgi:hypothetical protein
MIGSGTESFTGRTPDLLDRGLAMGGTCRTGAYTERQFQAQVIQLARLFGWRVAHFRAAQSQRGAWMTPVAADGCGWPDLSMVKRLPDGTARLLFVELKSARGVLREEQKAWLGLLRLVPAVEVYCWKPKDWDQIERVLRGDTP